MRPRTLLVLLLLVAGLGLYIGLYERKLPSSTERAAQEKKVLGLGKEEILGVTLESPAGSLTLDRAPQSPPAKKTGKGEAKGEAAETGEGAAPPGADWGLSKAL